MSPALKGSPLKKNRKGKETIQLHSTVKTSCEFNLTRYAAPAVSKRVYCLCIQARSRQYVADPSPRSATSCLGDLGGKCGATIWHSLQISLPPKSNRRELVRRLQAFATSTIDTTFQPALGNTWTGWHRETSRDVLLRCKAG